MCDECNDVGGRMPAADSRRPPASIVHESNANSGGPRSLTPNADSLLMTPPAQAPTIGSEQDRLQAAAENFARQLSGGAAPPETYIKYAHLLKQLERNAQRLDILASGAARHKDK